MTDLSKKNKSNYDQGVMKEFKPSSAVNQSKKKRDKRKAKKEEEKKIEAAKEQKRLGKEISRQKELYFTTSKSDQQ